MSREPAPSAEAAREERFRKATVDRWMERVGGSHLQKPPPTPRLSTIALPQPELAEMGVHVVQFGRPRTTSLLSSNSGASATSVEAPPPAYTRAA